MSLTLTESRIKNNKHRGGVVFNCRFRQGVDCCELLCNRCGWNPEVEEDRKEQFRNPKRESGEYVPTTFTNAWRKEDTQ